MTLIYRKSFVKQGRINEEFIEQKLKEYGIEVVISSVGGANILDQLTLIEAMEAVGTVKVCMYAWIQETVCACNLTLLYEHLCFIFPLFLVLLYLSN